MPVQMEDDVPLCPTLSTVIEMPSEFPEEDASLLPCASCNRTFNPKSLLRHEKVCQKVQTKKRNVSDQGKQRLGDAAESLISSKDKKKVQSKKKSKWREKHAEFLKTIRAARTTSDDSDEGSPQRLIPSDYIKCPHCDRYFGPKAADRHISWCEEQKTRVPRSHTNQDTQAIQRLKTRTRYAPPKPGQNGWRAPKKKDVISSIPPPNVGANMTPPGRLISPPPSSNRQFSPPPRNHSPPGVSPSRRSTLASLPPPSRYGSTSSLGRSSGKQFSSMLQSMTGCSTGYGLSSGYGSSSLYGSPNQGSSFNRSASLRLPRKRPTGAKRMARHRDLTSDMLSSVCTEGKRQEPEGGEDKMDPRRHYENSSYKMDDAPYDPFSAAELQFQDLLGPPKPGVGGLRSDLMGSTGSLQGIGLTRQVLERREYSPPKRNLGTMSLCSFRMNAFNNLNDGLKSPGDDSSEIESLGGYSNGMQSPIDEFEDLLASLTTNDRSNDYERRSESRNGSHTRNGILQNNKSQLLNDDSSSRIRPDGSYSWRKSPSPPYTQSPLRRSPSKERSPSPYNYSPLRRSPSKESPSPPYTYSPSKERSPSPYTYSPVRRSLSKERTSISPYSYSPLRRSPSKETSPPYQTSRTPATGFKKSELDDNHQRVSSGSSTDSSLPPLSSPMSSGSNLEPLKRSSTANNNSSTLTLPKFCYECGNKYPVSLAKFCCQCGAPRVTA